MVLATLNPALVRSIWRTALGFGIGFAFAGLVGGALSLQIHDDNTSRALNTLLYALAGALGGATLGWGRQSDKCWLAVAGALSCALGYYITAAIVSTYVDEHIQGFLAWDIALTIQFATIGSLTGLFLGLVQRSRQRLLRMILAGTIGFAPYYLASQLLVVIDPVWRLIPGTMGEVWHESLVAAIAACTWGAIGGIFIGVCFGIANIVRAQSPTRGMMAPIV